MKRVYFIGSLLILLLFCVTTAQTRRDAGGSRTVTGKTEDIQESRQETEEPQSKQKGEEQEPRQEAEGQQGTEGQQSKQKGEEQQKADGKLSQQENGEEQMTVGETSISLFSWHYELSDQPLFSQLAQPLKELGVTRIYQSVSARNIREPELAVMIQNLADMGIETVALTGDKSWIEDGLGELEGILEGIREYNAAAPENCRISRLALDVEVHRMEGWSEHKKELFGQYIEVMREAKEAANACGLQVIQIIPTRYDNVDRELFLTFLQECCDELSVMNYAKRSAETAIAYEVEACRRYGIPIETIFETMPVSEEYGVTEDITYFYDGMEALAETGQRMKEVYGRETGIAYHHFSTIYELVTHQKLGEIYLDFPKEEKNSYLGNLLLYGDDGSCLLAAPYWPGGRRQKGDFCWLLSGAREGVSYRIVYYDLLQEAVLADKAYFTKGDGVKLGLTITQEQ